MLKEFPLNWSMIFSQMINVVFLWHSEEFYQGCKDYYYYYFYLGLIRIKDSLAVSS